MRAQRCGLSHLLNPVGRHLCRRRQGVAGIGLAEVLLTTALRHADALPRFSPFLVSGRRSADNSPDIPTPDFRRRFDTQSSWCAEGGRFVFSDVPARC